MRAWRGLALFGALALLAGCGSSEGGGSAASSAGAVSNSPAEGGSPGSDGSAQFGMVTDTGGIDDLSFNMMAWAGLQRAEKELGVKVERPLESRQSADYAPNLQRLAEKGCDVVIAVGFAMEPALKEVAPKYPDTKFVLIDAAGPKADNVTGLTFREEEGSFLTGALAGGMTKTGTLGFVGGMEIPLIKKFEAGYRAGIQTVKPGAKVIAKYTNNWEDVPKGKELAVTLFSQGADIVMHASGRCGVGVIAAAKEKGDGFWAIGVDADQDYLGTADSDHPAPPSRVLTSMMKRVDNAVFAICQEVKQGTFNSGPRELGVKEDAVGLSPMKYTKSAVPPALIERVTKLQQAIADGKLHPPKTVEELASWKAPSGL
jgi:basic membrane protein A